MLKNSLQTKQCDSYKKIIFFQNKTFLQQQQSVSWCVYIFYPGMSTLFNLSACVHWVFSATNGNSLTQQFRLFLTDSSASLNGNLSGKEEIGLCKLFWYLCCICICVNLYIFFVFVQTFISICENLYLYCICANLYLYLCKLVFVFVFVQTYICVDFHSYLCNLVFVFFSQWKSVWNRGNCFFASFYIFNEPSRSTMQCQLAPRFVETEQNKNRTKV